MMTRVWLRGGVICTLALFMITACSSPVNGSGTTASKPESNAPTSSTATASAGAASTQPAPAPTPSADPGSTLESIALRRTDLAPGYQIQLMPGGDQVAGQVTLDNCGFTFTTEAHRVARRQYNVLTSASSPTGLSNELVAYDGPTQAARALTQWHTSAATCPHGAVHSTVVGEPDLIMKVSRNITELATLPIKQNALTLESGTATGQGTLYNVSILQIHGRYLDAMYLTTRTPITASEINATQQLATITGQRLAAVR